MEETDTMAEMAEMQETFTLIEVAMNGAKTIIVLEVATVANKQNLKLASLTHTSF